MTQQVIDMVAAGFTASWRVLPALLTARRAVVTVWETDARARISMSCWAASSSRSRSREVDMRSGTRP